MKHEDKDKEYDKNIKKHRAAIDKTRDIYAPNIKAREFMGIRGDILKRQNMIRKINTIIDYYQISDKRLMRILRTEIGAIQGIKARKAPIFFEEELQRYLDRLKENFKYQGEYENLDLFGDNL